MERPSCFPTWRRRRLCLRRRTFRNSQVAQPCHTKSPGDGFGLVSWAGALVEQDGLSLDCRAFHGAALIKDFNPLHNGPGVADPGQFDDIVGMDRTGALGAGQDEVRKALVELRDKLVVLHKALIDSERVEYESSFGT